MSIEETMKVAMDARDPQFAVLDMDGCPLAEGDETFIAAWLAEDAHEHAELRAESHGAYRNSYWPRSIVCADGDHVRNGQWSTSWSCHHGDGEMCPALEIVDRDDAFAVEAG